MALVRYIRRIWPTFTNVLHYAMRHNLPHVLDHTAQFLLSCKVDRVFPQPTIFQGAPEPLVVFPAFCVVGHPRLASTDRLEYRESYAWVTQAEVTGRNRNVFFSTGCSSLLQLCRRRDLVGEVFTSCRKESDRCCRHGISISWHGETFSAWEERQKTLVFFRTDEQRGDLVKFGDNRGKITLELCRKIVKLQAINRVTEYQT